MHQQNDLNISPQEQVVGRQVLEDDSMLFVETWKSSIARLNKEMKSVLLGISGLKGCERELSRVRAISLELKIEMYEMCIDRNNERRDGVHSPKTQERELQRLRFQRLMAAVAKSENDLEDNVQTVELVAGDQPDQEWSGEKWVTELHRVAAEACHRMAQI